MVPCIVCSFFQVKLYKRPTSFGGEAVNFSKPPGKGVPFFFLKIKALILLLLFILFILPKQNAYGESPRYGGTLTFAAMAQPLGLDPGTIIDWESAQVSVNIFETLVRYNPRKDSFAPLLATSWDSSSGGKVWTFYLRKGVKFHDGTPFNAAAVKTSWERQMGKNRPFSKPFYGEFTYYYSIWGGAPGNIKEIEIINDYTIRVKLYYRSARFLYIVSRLPFAVVSPAALARPGVNFSEKPVGTGPFKFVEWRKWHRIILVPNAQYWGGRPYVDRLIFEPTPGEYSRMRQIRRGHADITEYPNRDLLNRMKSGKVNTLILRSVDVRNFAYLSLNCQKAPLNSPLVRKAINYAIDKRLIQQTLDEGGDLASGPYENILGEDVSGRSYHYNPGTARALLAKAGYPRGFKMELWYLKNSTPFMLNQELAATIIAKNLRSVGIDVNLKGIRWENYINMLRYGDHQAAMMGFVDMDSDPQTYFQITWDYNNAVLGQTNYSFFRNNEIRELLKQADFTGERKNRIKYYRKIGEILADECPIVPLFSNEAVFAVNKRVRGIESNGDGTIDFSNAWLAW